MTPGPMSRRFSARSIHNISAHWEAAGGQPAPSLDPYRPFPLGLDALGLQVGVDPIGVILGQHGSAASCWRTMRSTLVLRWRRWGM